MQPNEHDMFTFGLELDLKGQAIMLTVYSGRTRLVSIRWDSIERCMLAGNGGEMPLPTTGEKVKFSDEELQEIYGRAVLAHFFSAPGWRWDEPEKPPANSL